MSASDQDLLSQDEIDALLHGVDNGEVATEDEVPAEPGTARAYDLQSQDRIVRGRMPTLEMINERFSRQLRISLFNMLRRSPDISVQSLEVLKFQDYVQSLLVPTNLNLIRLKPLHGTALLVVEPGLLFALVDNFFGGGGRFHTKIEGREFTPTEMRVVKLLLAAAFEDLGNAWRPVMDVEFEYLSSEVNPHFANIVSPSEAVVISRFHIELDGGGGDLHLTVPYSMLEPIREQLNAGIASDRGGSDGHWARSLRDQLSEAPVELSSMLAETRISLGDLMRMRAGDVIPIELPKRCALLVEDVPTYFGEFGISGGNNAIKITEVAAQRRPATTH